MGSIPGWDSYLRQVSFTLISYVDPALIGYLDVRRLVSRILGTWRRCGMVDNISYVQGPAQPLVIIHHPHVSTAGSAFGNYSPPTRFNCLCEQGIGGLEGHIGLPAYATSALSLWVLCGQRGAWAPCIYKVYLVYRELCHLVQYTCPIVLLLISGL